MTTDKPSFQPLYQQIRTLLAQRIAQGEWAAHEALPSEWALAESLGVSQGTVRKAIDELAQENHLVRRQGKGTFVATHSDPRSFFRFLRLVPNEGELQPSRSVPLECGRAKAGADVARMLGLEPGAPIIIMRRLLKFAEDAVVFDEIYLPGELFQDLSLDVLKQSDKSL